MGYETRLLIGRESSFTSSEIKCGDLILEDGEAYRPMIRDDKDGYIKTGRKETLFMIMAEIDLCKCGHNAHIHEVDRINKDENHFWYWWHGNERAAEDCYGEKLKPVPIADVVVALEKDVADDANDYRRFRWALALLYSMKDDPEKLSALLYGH